MKGWLPNRCAKPIERADTLEQLRSDPSAWAKLLALEPPVIVKKLASVFHAEDRFATVGVLRIVSGSGPLFALVRDLAFETATDLLVGLVKRIGVLTDDERGSMKDAHQRYLQRRRQLAMAALDAARVRLMDEASMDEGGPVSKWWSAERRSEIEALCQNVAEHDRRVNRTAVDLDHDAPYASIRELCRTDVVPDGDELIFGKASRGPAVARPRDRVSPETWMDFQDAFG